MWAPPLPNLQPLGRDVRETFVVWGFDPKFDDLTRESGHITSWHVVKYTKNLLPKTFLGKVQSKCTINSCLPQLNSSLYINIQNKSFKSEGGVFLPLKPFNEGLALSKFATSVKKFCVTGRKLHTFFC